MRKPHILLTLLLMSTLLLSACQQTPPSSGGGAAAPTAPAPTAVPQQPTPTVQAPEPPAPEQPPATPDEPFTAGPDDIPLMPDATNVTAVGPLITYTSPSTADVIADFYRTQMLDNGWKSAASEIVTEEDILLQFNKEGQVAFAGIRIFFNSDDGPTEVLIAFGG